MEQDPPVLYMNSAGYRVIKIKLPKRVLYLDTHVNRLLGEQTWSLNLLDDRFYRVSAAENVFAALGCGFKFSVSLPKAGGNASTCNSTCHPDYPNMATDGTCSGVGCCYTTVAEDSNSYVIKLLPLDEANSTLSGGPRVSVNATFLVEKEEYWMRTGYAIPLQKYAATLGSAPEVPTQTVVNWMLGNSSCAEALKSGDFGCQSGNSDCHDDPRGGYACQCQPGYQGNPYMHNGCQGMIALRHLELTSPYDCSALITVFCCVTCNRYR